MKRDTTSAPGITDKMKGDNLLADLLYRYRRAAQVQIAELVFSHLNHKPIVANTLIEGNTLIHTEAGLKITPDNGSAAPAKPKYRRSAAGRARQVKAMKRYWAKKRKAARK